MVVSTPSGHECAKRFRGSATRANPRVDHRPGPDVVQYRCYTCPMPTQHKRHSVTETPEVAQALAPLRARAGEVRLGELVVLGAREKLRQLVHEDPAAQAARERLARRTVDRCTGGDPALADRVRREGWTRT